MADPLTTGVLSRLTDALSGPQVLGEALAIELTSVIQGDTGDESTRQQVLEMLADAARQVSWRGIFGQTGMLASCSRGLHPGEPEDILKQKLRLIGNCCADNDSNRDIIIETECYEKLACISSTLLPLRALSMVVIFNFMNEYESAQRHAFKHGLVGLLTKILRRDDKQPDPALEYPLRCLELILQLDLSLGDEASELIILLLDWAVYPTTQFDIFYVILSCLLALHKEEYTKAFNLNPSPVSNYVELVTRLKYWEDKATQTPELVPDDMDSEDVARLINGARRVAIATISEISASESFHNQYPTGSAFLNSIFGLLASSDPNFLACSALIFGNVARDAEACKALIDEYQLHLSLVNVIREQTQIGVLHAAGGALKNLVVGFPEIREQVVQEGALQYCQKFYLASVMIEVQHMGLSLVRILVAMSQKNVECLFLPYEGESSPSAIEQILELYVKNTEVPVRIEIGRIVVSVLREAAKTKPAEQTKVSLQQRVIVMSPRILEPVIDMVIQEKWPVVASEGWFAFALCVQTTGGANAVAGLSFSETFFKVLRRVLSQTDGALEPMLLEELSPGSGALDSKSNPRLQKDRENVYMFLSGFLKHNTSQESQPYTTLFRWFLEGREVTDTQIKEALGSLE
ncbi:hypothetical protein TWF718_002738 [Orbilia javanica]|uniref:Uncharacterized protein n=1 Tax=Orbilia javanica TaxID=47235 RepID=A0AAN8MMV8_9PEZI